jgi:hypothetical protein
MSTRCYFFLLLASVTALSSINSIFAVALRRDDEESGRNTACVDSSEFNMKKRSGDKMEFCKWVDEKPINRCARAIKKRKRIPGTEKKVVVWIKAIDHCGCICADFKEATEETPGDKLCPEASNLSELANKNCRKDGYNEGQVCGYAYTWTQCTYDDLWCAPRFECECGNPDANRRGGKNNWLCSTFEYTGVGHYSQCPQFNDSGNMLREPFPDDYVPLPDEAGQSCKKEDNDNPPKAPPTSVAVDFVTDETPVLLGIRRNLLRK